MNNPLIPFASNLLIIILITINITNCSTSIISKNKIRAGESKYFNYRFIENPDIVNKIDLREYLDNCSEYFANNDDVRLYLTMFVNNIRTQNQRSIAENLYNQIISYLVSRGVPRGQIFDRYGDSSSLEPYFKYDEIIVEIVVK